MRKGVMQKSNIIKEKTYQFALDIINLYSTMQKHLNIQKLKTKNSQLKIK